MKPRKVIKPFTSTSAGGPADVLEQLIREANLLQTYLFDIQNGDDKKWGHIALQGYFKSRRQFNKALQKIQHLLVGVE